jgi:putative ABC transport system ATP-binding protein
MSLSLDQVSFAYPDGPVVLEKASITFEAGSFTIVQGLSGAGKSTLLRLLCRLEEAQSGRILFNGQPIEAMAPADLRRSVAYVQQMPTLLSSSVRENLLLPFSFKANAGLNRPSDEVLTSHLESFLLSGVTLESEATRLSVGQAQRICLIRSLLLDPEIVLLDEPTASLDAESAGVVLEKAAELGRGGMTVIMISHSQTMPEGVTHVVTIKDRNLERA